MTEVTPAIRALQAELSQAIRRDHARRARRRKALRTGGLSVLTLTAVSSAALAAGGAFRQVETVTPVGEVELPQHVTIQAVDSFPEFVGKASTSGFVTRAAGGRWGRYVYHVTGGEARDIGCGYAQVPTNNVYITSRRPLSEREIRSLLKPDGELDELAPRPAWITSTSAGCPNPGLAGQPGQDNGPILPGKAAVATPTSPTTRILVRTKKTVPAISPTSPGGTSTTTTAPAPPPTPSQPTETTTSTAPSTPTSTLTPNTTSTITPTPTP
jgi:hypothetical protein